MKKIFVVGTAYYYAKWIKDSELVYNIEDADIVLFTGGEDVTPAFYEMDAHPFTYSNINRDITERNIFNKINHDKQLYLGICRGSQFGTVMAGGLLVQHCNNHAVGGTHTITFNDGKLSFITSTHHQMMYPYNLPKEDYELIAYSSETRSPIHEGVGWNKDMLEPEIVYYKNINALCIQGHPEMMEEAPIHTILNNLIDSFLK